MSQQHSRMLAVQARQWAKRALTTHIPPLPTAAANSCKVVNVQNVSRSLASLSLSFPKTWQTVPKNKHDFEARQFSTTTILPPDQQQQQQQQHEAEDQHIPDQLTPSHETLLNLLQSQPRHLTKLRPAVVKQRLQKCTHIVGREKNIRVSPWKLNLICQMVAGLTVEEALLQLQFCDKRKAPLVAKVVRRTANLAEIKHSLTYPELEIAQCFSTHGTPLKRITYHSKGRYGKRYHRHAHIRLELREIDFSLKVVQARTRRERVNWLLRKQRAEAMRAEKEREREEMEELERMAERAALAAKEGEEKK